MDLQTIWVGDGLMNKKMSRVCALVLSLSFVLSSGCKKNNKDKRQRVVQESDPYYSCEEVLLDLEVPEEEGKELKHRGIFDIHIYADRVLILLNESYIVPEDLQKRWDNRVLDPSLTTEDLEKLNEEYSSYQRSGIAVLDFSGKMINFIDIDGRFGGDVSLCEDASGNPKVAISSVAYEYSKTVIYDVSPEGELVNELQLEGDSSGQGYILFLDNGNMLTIDWRHILLFSADGKFLGKDSVPFLVDKLIQIEGKYYAYMMIENYYASSEEDELMLYMQEIDPSTGKKIGELIDVEDWVAGDRLVQCRDGAYFADGTGISKVDVPGGKEPQRVLSWSETDSNLNITEKAPSLYFASDKDIYTTCRVYDSESMSIYGRRSSIYLQHFHREEKNPHAGKNILYLAYIDSVSDDFLQYLTVYNQDPDKKQRILIENYSGQSALSTPIGTIFGPTVDEKAKLADQIYLDILAGEGPDILLNFGSFSQFDTERALLDLNTMIDGDSPLDRSLYYDNIFRAYERNGKLYQMPMTFGVTGMLVNSDYVSERTGWTYDEFWEISKTLPPDILMYNKVPQKDLLETLMNGSFSHFLDYDNRTVNFEDPEFAGILDMVKTYGSPKSQGELDLEHDQDPTGTVLNEWQMFIAEMLVTINYSFSGLSQFAYIEGVGNKKAFFIGYPNAAGYGAKADKATTIAISRSCPYKDEAWDFLKYLFEDDYQTACARKINGGFPVNRKAFDACMDYGIAYNQYEWELKEKDPSLVTDLIWYSIHIGQEHIDALKKVIENIHDSCSTDPSALMIIQEEAPGYFTGQRTLDDVVSIIQKRAAAVVQERG